MAVRRRGSRQDEDSTLTDINPSNLNRLQKAWEWKHFDVPMEQFGTIPGFFEATPLMIDGVLYVTTPYNNIAALDAETGKELWRFDGEAYKLGQVLSGSGYKLRGTSFWRDGNNLRLFLNSRERLFMIDAKTGKPVPSFGVNGEIRITDGLTRVGEPQHYTQSSPPMIYKDLVIMGSQVPDRVQTADPVGQVQAVNARTGKRAWVWSVIPLSSSDAGAETWEGESWKTHGHGNVWAPMALDAERGLLYLPTTTPSSDFYGGNRPGANLYAESVVCLDANTGKMKRLPGDSSRSLGLGFPGAAEPHHDHGRWQEDRCRGAGQQAGLYLRLRSRDRAAGMADHRAAGADRFERPRREAVPDAAVSHQAAAIHRSGRDARRRQQPDA